MNCLEFRRQLSIDPQCAAADFVRHRQECARCAEALERASAFEGALRNALAVPVPPQLADSILLAQATGEEVQRTRRRRRGELLAFAAAILIAVGVLVQSEASALASLAVQHLNKEAFVLAMSQPIADDEVRKAFAENGIRLEQVPAGISFVYCCPVGRYHSVHLVMPQQEGPLTVLYLTEDAAKQREDKLVDGWHVRSVPLAHGTLVLLAHDARHFDQIESTWRATLDKSA
jgi:hypothetical protein